MNTNNEKNVILLNWSTTAAQFWRMVWSDRFTATHAHILWLICNGHRIQFLYLSNLFMASRLRGFSSGGQTRGQAQAGFTYLEWNSIVIRKKIKKQNENSFLLHSKQKTRIVEKMMDTKPVYHRVTCFLV